MILHVHAPAAEDHIGQKFNQQKTESFQPRALKYPGKPQAPDAFKKVVGDQPGQKQRAVGPEAACAERGGLIIFKLLDHLLHHCAAVVGSPDVFSIRNSRPYWKSHDIFIELSSNTVARRLVTPIKYRISGFQRKRYHQEWELMTCDDYEAIAKA
jgi:hypothetical protein